MAQKVTGIIKLQINAAKATASPPVGPALGQHGVNIAAFIKEFNARTQAMEGYKIPVVITVYADRSFTGRVESVEVDKNRVNVVVSMFGRETSVEFELDQVEVVSP